MELEKVKPIYAVVGIPSYKIMNTYKDPITALKCNKTRMKYQGFKLIKFIPSEEICQEQ